MNNPKASNSTNSAPSRISSSLAPAGRGWSATWLVCSLLGLTLCAGCVTETVKPTRSTTRPVQLTGIDACGLNMHDLSSYLLEYYAIHHDLPETLEELRPLVDIDKELPLACPASGKPYLYYRDGLVASGEQRRLLIVDAEPSHDGKRWAIVTIPREGKTPLGLWVVLLKDAAVKQFHAPQPAGDSPG